MIKARLYSKFEKSKKFRFVSYAHYMTTECARIDCKIAAQKLVNPFDFSGYVTTEIIKDNEKELIIELCPVLAIYQKKILRFTFEPYTMDQYNKDMGKEYKKLIA